MTNELDDSSQINNELRPYFTKVTEHEQALATIILLAHLPPNPLEDDTPIDYLHSFTSTILPPSSVMNDQPQDLSYHPGTINTGGTVPKLFDMEAPGVTEYYGVFNNFSLVNITEAKEQMAKIHMNFGGSWNAFFFGDKPTIYSFNGFFLDSQEYPYYQEFMEAYDKYLSGRKCIENQFEMLISYDGKIINGYILGINTNLNATNPYMKSFSFSVLIKAEAWYRTNIVRGINNQYVTGFNYKSSKRVTSSYLDYNSNLIPISNNTQLIKPTSQGNIVIPR
jgi:hypothetical protein